MMLNGKPASFPGRHLPLEAAVREGLVADDVDLADARARPLVHFEHHIHAVLIELDDLRLHSSGEAALPAVQLDDTRHVGTRPRTGEDLAGRKPDFRKDLVVLQAAIAPQG
jgi:hypothetical protein